MEFESLVTKQAHESGAKCHLIGSDGKLADAYVVVQGPDSPSFRMAKRKQRQKIVELQEAKTDFNDYDFMPLDVNFVCSLVIDWGDITKGGKPLKYSPEACKELFENSPVNVERVLDFCGERENFTKG